MNFAFAQGQEPTISGRVEIRYPYTWHNKVLSCFSNCRTLNHSKLSFLRSVVFTRLLLIAKCTNNEIFFAKCVILFVKVRCLHRLRLLYHFSKNPEKPRVKHCFIVKLWQLMTIYLQATSRKQHLG